ncbi:major facilitator superfamily domain-containing protein [Aspergillus cavernicola]|uniref:Major facilitator superfamily domain-containing protein n=1 Tax=Aspergillus cavernicola TaxID=176166 RepID=A0ABR4IBC1_9EURO
MATGREDPEPALGDASGDEQTPLLRRDSVNSVAAPVSVSRKRGLTILFTMGILIFIQAINMSMMTTAQSDIATDLNAFGDTTWFNSAFMIAMSSVTPLAGRLTQIFTPRVYVLFSCVMLAIGLFVTAAAPKLSVFLLGRALTGTGAGGLMVTGIILTLDLVNKKRRGIFIGMVNFGMTIGVSLGAVLAGVVVPTLGWRFIFWVQAPTCLVLGPIIFFAIPSHPHYEHGDTKSASLLQKLKNVDYAGAITLALSIFLLLFSLASPVIPITPIILSVILFAVFWIIESKFTAEPIVPTEVLKMRSVLLTCLAALSAMTARWSILFYSPVYAMVVRGWSPASAGLILTPTNAGFGFGGLLVGWLHIRHGESYYRSNVLVYLLFALSNLLVVALSTQTSPAAAYIFSMFLNGFCIGASMNYTFAHILHLTPPEVHYIVTALVGMARGFAGSFGSAMGGGFFQRELQAGLEDGFAKHGLSGKDGLIHKLLGSPALVRQLTGVEREVAVQSYEHAIKMLLLGGFVILIVATIAQAGTGWTPPLEETKVQEDEDLHRED